MITSRSTSAETAQAGADRVRVGDVDGEPVGAPAELCRDRVRTRLVAAADRDVRAARDVGLGERAAEPGRASDDHDLACHQSGPPIPLHDVVQNVRRNLTAARADAKPRPGEPSPERCIVGSWPRRARTRPESAAAVLRQRGRQRPRDAWRADPAGAARGRVQRARPRRPDGGLAEPDLADRAGAGDALGGDAVGRRDRARASRSAISSTAGTGRPRRPRRRRRRLSSATGRARRSRLRAVFAGSGSRPAPTRASSSSTSSTPPAPSRARPTRSRGTAARSTAT